MNHNNNANNDDNDNAHNNDNNNNNENHDNDNHNDHRTAKPVSKGRGEASAEGATDGERLCIIVDGSYNRYV